jgi:hypothetical protein
MNSTAARPATTPQHDLIRTLLIELGEISPLGVELADLARELMNNKRFVEKSWDFDAASAAITVLKNAKGRAKAALAIKPETGHQAVPAAAKAKVEIPAVPAGSYGVEIDGTWKFYRVDVSKSGFVTAYVQASEDFHKLHFGPMVEVLKAIVAATPLEASKAYGREMGECGKCHRKLTDPTSIAEGIGPICAGKLS